MRITEIISQDQLDESLFGKIGGNIARFAGAIPGAIHGAWDAAKAGYQAARADVGSRGQSSTAAPAPIPAPVGTVTTLQGQTYIKTSAGWVNQTTGVVNKLRSNVGRALEAQTATVPTTGAQHSSRHNTYPASAGFAGYPTGAPASAGFAGYPTGAPASAGFAGYPTGAPAPTPAPTGAPTPTPAPAGTPAPTPAPTGAPAPTPAQTRTQRQAAAAAAAQQQMATNPAPPPAPAPSKPKKPKKAPAPTPTPAQTRTQRQAAAAAAAQQQMATNPAPPPAPAPSKPKKPKKAPAPTPTPAQTRTQRQAAAAAAAQQQMATNPAPAANAAAQPPAPNFRQQNTGYNAPAPLDLNYKFSTPTSNTNYAASSVPKLSYPKPSAPTPAETRAKRQAVGTANARRDMATNPKPEARAAYNRRRPALLQRSRPPAVRESVDFYSNFLGKDI